MPCALLGDRASGKTTFLGLLYSAQVKYGTGVQDDFRFHAPIQSLNIMSAVYEGMKDGRFPSATLKEEITELGFVFGYLRKADFPKIYPVFVLSKFDTLRDDVLARLGLHRGFPDNNRARKEYAEALLRVFVPQTLSQIRGGKVAGVSMDKSAYFLSWVRTETHEGMDPVGQSKIVRTGFAPEGGGEPDFSYDEYVNFIEHFREIAHKIPDEILEAERFQAQVMARSA